MSAAGDEPGPDAPPPGIGVFVVVVVPRSGDVPDAVRVRRWLKAGLRGYGLSCRLIRRPTLPELLAPDLADELGPDPDEDQRHG